MQKRNFYKDIEKFNKMYNLPENDKPTLHGIERLEKFKDILLEEVEEVDEIIKEYKKQKKKLTKEKELGLLTDISDWLGDMVVYISSEAKNTE